MTAFSRPALSRFLILYAALYAGFGVQSPYLPESSPKVAEKYLRPEAIALVLAAGSAVRLVAGPAAGRLADELDAPKVILSLCSAAAALIALGYLPARGLWLLFAVGVFHSAALAPLAPLSDTLALGTAAAARSDDTVRRGFEYGWVRGAGSAAFILRYHAVPAKRSGILELPRSSGSMRHSSPPRHSPLYWCRACCRCKLWPEPRRGSAELVRCCGCRSTPARSGRGIDYGQPRDARQLCRDPVGCRRDRPRYRRAAVVPIGRSRGNGVPLCRPPLARPSGAAMLAAAAGMVRWAVMAETAWLPVLATIEPLHGLTFALLHLTCMRLLAGCVPRHLAATALTLYGTVGIGAPATLLTLASGPLYAHFGAHGFWVMAALCAAALPLARTLREPFGKPT